MSGSIGTVDVELEALSGAGVEELLVVASQVARAAKHGHHASGPAKSQPRRRDGVTAPSPPAVPSCSKLERPRRATSTKPLDAHTALATPEGAENVSAGVVAGAISSALCSVSERKDSIASGLPSPSAMTGQPEQRLLGVESQSIEVSHRCAPLSSTPRTSDAAAAALDLIQETPAVAAEQVVAGGSGIAERRFRGQANPHQQHPTHKMQRLHGPGTAGAGIPTTMGRREMDEASEQRLPLTVVAPPAAARTVSDDVRPQKRGANTEENGGSGPGVGAHPLLPATNLDEPAATATAATSGPTSVAAARAVGGFAGSVVRSGRRAAGGPRASDLVVARNGVATPLVVVRGNALTATGASAAAAAVAGRGPTYHAVHAWPLSPEPAAEIVAVRGAQQQLQPQPQAAEARSSHVAHRLVFRHGDAPAARHPAQTATATGALGGQPSGVGASATHPASSGQPQGASERRATIRLLPENPPPLPSLASGDTLLAAVGHASAVAASSSAKSTSLAPVSGLPFATPMVASTVNPAVAGAAAQQQPQLSNDPTSHWHWQSVRSGQQQQQQQQRHQQQQEQHRMQSDSFGATNAVLSNPARGRFHASNASGGPVPSVTEATAPRRPAPKTPHAESSHGRRKPGATLQQSQQQRPAAVAQGIPQFAPSAPTSPVPVMAPPIWLRPARFAAEATPSVPSVSTEEPVGFVEFTSSVERLVQLQAALVAARREVVLASRAIASKPTRSTVPKSAVPSALLRLVQQSAPAAATRAALRAASVLWLPVSAACRAVLSSHLVAALATRNALFALQRPHPPPMDVAALARPATSPVDERDSTVYSQTHQPPRRTLQAQEERRVWLLQQQQLALLAQAQRYPQYFSPHPYMRHAESAGSNNDCAQRLPVSGLLKQQQQQAARRTDPQQHLQQSVTINRTVPSPFLSDQFDHVDTPARDDMTSASRTRSTCGTADSNNRSKVLLSPVDGNGRQGERHRRQHRDHDHGSQQQQQQQQLLHSSTHEGDSGTATAASSAHGHRQLSSAGTVSNDVRRMKALYCELYDAEAWALDAVPEERMTPMGDLEAIAGGSRGESSTTPILFPQVRSSSSGGLYEDTVSSFHTGPWLPATPGVAGLEHETADLPSQENGVRGCSVVEGGFDGGLETSQGRNDSAHGHGSVPSATTTPMMSGQVDDESARRG